MTKDKVRSTEEAFSTVRALKLALDALETSMYPQQKQLQAITAIKEAFAQPDYRAVKTYHEGKPVYVSQPEREPVAWHTEDHLTDRSATTYSKEMVYRWECKGWPVTPLYTTPPQRKPLTEDEVVKMDEWLFDQPFWRVLMLARAIEAAHGIKGEA